MSFLDRLTSSKRWKTKNNTNTMSRQAGICSTPFASSINNWSEGCCMCLFFECAFPQVDCSWLLLLLSKNTASLPALLSLSSPPFILLQINPVIPLLFMLWIDPENCSRLLPKSSPIKTPWLYTMDYPCCSCCWWIGLKFVPMMGWGQRTKVCVIWQRSGFISRVAHKQPERFYK